MIGRALDRLGRVILHLLDRLGLVQEVRPTVRIHDDALSCLLEGLEAAGLTPTLLQETDELLEAPPSILAADLAIGESGDFPPIVVDERLLPNPEATDEIVGVLRGSDLVEEYSFHNLATSGEVALLPPLHDFAQEAPMEITDSTPWTLYVSKAGVFVLNKKNAPLWDLCLDDELDGIQELLGKLPVGGTILGLLDDDLQEEVVARGFEEVGEETDPAQFRRLESKRPGLAAGRLPNNPEGRADK